MYLYQEGNLLHYLKKHNPKQFFKRFKNKRKQVNTSLTINDFFNHFKNLTNTDHVEHANITQMIDEFDDILVNPHNESVFEELDKIITPVEIEHVISNLK